MKEEDQRIAIAEACGWEYNHNEIRYGYPMVRHPIITNGEWMTSEGSVIPHYTHCLNAMHEAEEFLDADEILAADYADRLCNLHHGNAFESIRSTAAQRAETFLKCLNLWEYHAK